MTNIFKTLQKIAKISIKLRFSDRLFERSQGGGGEGVATGADGKGVDNIGVSKVLDEKLVRQKIAKKTGRTNIIAKISFESNW